ncbi:MAG: hypothetical protein JRN52_16100, partial [Nitrososphaerota archaeon]|nr:hypothetical protein [Nitrososphaerota archaeon]
FRFFFLPVIFLFGYPKHTTAVASYSQFENLSWGRKLLTVRVALETPNARQKTVEKGGHVLGRNTTKYL